MKNKVQKVNRFMKKIFTPKKMLIMAFMLFAVADAYATNTAGATAIGSASKTIGNYIGEVEPLIKAVAAIVGFIGALRIYNKWQNGDQDINKEIMGWAGSAIFLYLAPTFVKAMFGF